MRIVLIVSMWLLAIMAYASMETDTNALIQQVRRACVVYTSLSQLQRLHACLATTDG
jgi:hypothetical protein